MALYILKWSGGGAPPINSAKPTVREMTRRWLWEYGFDGLVRVATSALPQCCCRLDDLMTCTIQTACHDCVAGHVAHQVNTDTTWEIKPGMSMNTTRRTVNDANR